jgi:hypothetical protein
VHLALDVKLFHLSLGTNNFITKGCVLRKQFMSKLVGKNILFPSMSKQNKVWKLSVTPKKLLCSKALTKKDQKNHQEVYAVQI